MSNITFKHFPTISECPLCLTNEDKECCLIPIDGTDNDGICKAQPMHVECVQKINLFRYNKDHNLLYRKN